jgi:GNAT superfamily N-acetyltransferase
MMRYSRRPDKLLRHLPLSSGPKVAEDASAYPPYTLDRTIHSRKMNDTRNVLSTGYSAIPPGHFASVVTSLEMRTRPAPRPAPPFPVDVRLEKLVRPELTRYRDLFRTVGENWLWFSRLFMRDEELRSILHDPRVEIQALRLHGRDVGILELDFRQARECELAFFGLTAEVTGQGLGRALMNLALERAWSRPIERFWVHTCTFDGPTALDFYRRSGFTPYAFQVEVQADPRLTGHLPLHAAPQVPLIRIDRGGA